MDNNKLTYSVPELASALGIGRNAAYDLTQREDFPAVRIGRRVIIPAELLEIWLAKQAGAVE